MRDREDATPPLPPVAERGGVGKASLPAGPFLRPGQQLPRLSAVGAGALGWGGLNRRPRGAGSARRRLLRPGRQPHVAGLEGRRGRGGRGFLRGERGPGGLGAGLGVAAPGRARGLPERKPGSRAARALGSPLRRRFPAPRPARVPALGPLGLRSPALPPPFRPWWLCQGRSLPSPPRPRQADRLRRRARWFRV